MGKIDRLDPGQLYHRCNPDDFGFDSTSELDDFTDVLGQSRAVDAITFGVGIRRDGYNLFAMGPTGTGKHTIVRRFLDRQAADAPPAPDWCYVHNFTQPHRPTAIQLPPGKAVQFKKDMEQLVDELKSAIPSAFETDEYRAHAREIEDEFNSQQEKALEDLRTRAEAKGLALLRTPGGIAFAPRRDGDVLDPEAFKNLSAEERERIETDIRELEKELGDIIHHLPKQRRETLRRLRELKRTVTRSAVNSLIDELKKKYSEQPRLGDYLADVQKDVIENADDFRPAKEGEQPTFFGMPVPQQRAGEDSLRRYQVNVVIDHSVSKGAPIVYEDNPTYQNLVGRIEHLSQMGALVTDFTLIKPGALHRANGGYVIVDALKVLVQPFAWDGLKRALRSQEIRMESIGQMLSLISTVSLEPEPIPLDLKVVLLGERLLYYLLYQADPDFRELFKVAVDFEESMDRSQDACKLYSRFLATFAREGNLLPFDRTGVARVIEHSSRLSGDAEKLSLQMRGITDLMREADYWARLESRSVVNAADVQRAIDAHKHRTDRMRERLQEEVLRGTILIDTSGDRVGQVNGLSVMQLGGFSFGQPSRITARVRMGGGKVVDIEREVELGGPLHSKGVLILSGFLAGRYAPDKPLSLSASVVFEQSYGGVDGDSASSAELYALLSALADVPIRQDFAVTGSVNQLGQVQAIGGVNEKIEGFFDVCSARGLTGEQGVLIPRSNVKHLMLRQDVIDAAAQGKFHIYPVDTIDHGIEILTGVPAGERNAAGEFPRSTINGRVERRLTEFAEQARDFKTSRPKKRKS